MITERIIIDEVECLLQHDGLSDVISKVFWRYVVEADTGESEEFQFVTPLNSPDPSNYIPFSTFVENDPTIVSWIEGNVEDNMKTLLRQLVEEKINPNKVKRVLGNG
jgi:hypothetical protein